MRSESKQRRKRKSKRKLDFDEQLSGADEQSYQEASHPKHDDEEDSKKLGSRKHLKQGDDETMGESADDHLPSPYQFLRLASPPLHTIFFPHFTVKSVTFIMSLILVLGFVAEIIYIYTRSVQNEFTWNCSLFELQNKYYPRIKFDYQVWRILVSPLFHSNYAHFVLNIIGIQIYGYFVQWYYGKLKYIVTLVCGILFAGFFSNLVMMESISTMPSAILYSILALKVYFFYQYYNYQKLENRKLFLYLLWALILGINLIPIFTNNNVDFTSHLGGFICGLLMGCFFHYLKIQQELTKCQQILKYGSLVMLTIGMIMCCALMFVLTVREEHLEALNNGIESYCD